MPSEFVVVFTVTPVEGEANVTVAPAIMLPDLSATVPVTVPRVD